MESQPPTTSEPVLIPLRSGGKLHGRLEVATLRLVVRRGDWLTIYDLPATARCGRAVVVERRRVSEKSTPS